MENQQFSIMIFTLLSLSKLHWTLKTGYFEDPTPAIQVQTLALEGPRSLGYKKIRWFFNDYALRFTGGVGHRSCQGHGHSRLSTLRDVESLRGGEFLWNGWLCHYHGEPTTFIFRRKKTCFWGFKGINSVSLGSNTYSHEKYQNPNPVIQNVTLVVQSPYLVRLGVTPKSQTRLRRC